MEAYGFNNNQYDPCIANATINGKHNNVTFHRYDLKVYHKDPYHVTKFACYIPWIYRKEIKTERGKVNYYLVMDINDQIFGVNYGRIYRRN